MFQELQDFIILGNLDLKRTNLTIEGYGEKHLNINNAKYLNK